jgi:tetratricopeptide (TPR) repeat protein
MKKVVFVSVLALATTSLGRAPMLFAQQQQQPSCGQLTIPQAEYSDYNNAIGQSDPKAKAAAIEDFLQKHPDSIVKSQLLDTLMTIYVQQLNDMDKAKAAANKLLAIDPNNIRALFVITFIDKNNGDAAMQKDPASAQPILDEGAADAQKALAAPKPACMSDADFSTLKAQVTPTFYETIALDDQNKKDYTGAITALTNELKSYANPNTETQTGPGLNDTYVLGQLYAQETPPDSKNAAWFLTRAAQFAPASAKPQIESAAEYFYKKFHGSLDDYPQVQALAQANVFPPATYNPTPAPPPPSPADLAHQTVASTPDLTQLSLSDREFILLNGSPDDAAKVWNVMKGQRVGVPGVVISATADSVQLAVTEENQQSKKADFTINMKTPLKTLPAVGSSVTYDATFDSYTTNPFMITLVDGEVPPKPAAHRPVHRPAR